MNAKLISILMLASLSGAAIVLATQLADDRSVRAEQDQDQNSPGTDNFEKMMQVITHQRCVNCHPSDGVPKQGEDAHPHYFGIARGSNGRGFEVTKCNTCHQSENNDFSGVPGAPDWALAPESMRWQGLSRTKIAESMLDPKRNGNRNHEQVMHHLTEHALVLWAWEPGIDADGKLRETPPVPKDEFIKAVKQWFQDGAKIPAE